MRQTTVQMRIPVTGIVLHIGITAGADVRVTEVRQDAPSAMPSWCRVSGELVRVPGLPEGSGIAASRGAPGALWAHNARPPSRPMCCRASSGDRRRPPTWSPTCG